MPQLGNLCYRGAGSLTLFKKEGQGVGSLQPDLFHLCFQGDAEVSFSDI